MTHIPISPLSPNVLVAAFALNSEYPTQLVEQSVNPLTGHVTFTDEHGTVVCTIDSGVVRGSAGNALGTLIRDNHQWVFTQPTNTLEIPDEHEIAVHRIVVQHLHNRGDLTW